MHKIQYAQNNEPVKIWTQLVVKSCEIIMEDKTPLLHEVANYFFLEKNFTLIGAVSHNVL